MQRDEIQTSIDSEKSDIRVYIEKVYKNKKEFKKFNLKLLTIKTRFHFKERNSNKKMIRLFCKNKIMDGKLIVNKL